MNYTHEVERLEKVCSEEEQEIDNLEHVLTILERYERVISFSPTSKCAEKKQRGGVYFWLLSTAFRMLIHSSRVF